MEKVKRNFLREFGVMKFLESSWQIVTFEGGLRSLKELSFDKISLFMITADKRYAIS